MTSGEYLSQSPVVHELVVNLRMQKSADRDHSDRMIMITGIGDVIT
jgi:hypothetical protein